MAAVYLSEQDVARLLDLLSQDHETFFFQRDSVTRYDDWKKKGGEISFRQARSSFPAKSFFLPVREHLADYGAKAGFDAGAVGDQAKPVALVNLRSCDLNALKVLDRIFLEADLVDPFYQQKRDNTFIVSVDCEDITDYCFCTSVDYEPYVTEPQGINLSPVEGGYIATASGERGEKLLAQVGRQEPSPTQESQAEQTRQNTLGKLKENNEKFASTRPYREILQEKFPVEKWNDLFNSCVECASCTNICPTCYCFYMFDKRKFADEADTFERLRSWDSCLLADYSRMAGVGGVKPNPRARIRTRYENRFRHKYQYYPEIYDAYGCTGCGRCSESCMGQTDPREVMRVLSQ